MKRFKTVDDFMKATTTWQKELQLLRQILLNSGLEETVKWGAPTYTFSGKNIVGLASFKSYFGLWFYQGALLTDVHGKLINAQENKTVAMRQWRFTNESEIDADLIASYIAESAQHVRDGNEIKPQRNKTLTIPDELSNMLAQDAELNVAFGKMTLGKKREYADYISEAKRPETKEKRLLKIAPMILNGKGLHDKYR